MWLANWFLQLELNFSIGCIIPAVWPPVNHLTSLSISFLIFQMGMVKRHTELNWRLRPLSSSFLNTLKTVWDVPTIQVEMRVEESNGRCYPLVVELGNSELHSKEKSVTWPSDARTVAGKYLLYKLKTKQNNNKKKPTTGHMTG